MLSKEYNPDENLVQQIKKGRILPRVMTDRFGNKLPDSPRLVDAIIKNGELRECTGPIHVDGCGNGTGGNKPES